MTVPIAGITPGVLAKAIAGESNAVTVIWRHWNPRLVRFFRSRNVSDPDDLASAVWIDIAAKLSDFEGDPAAFRRWLFTLAHRRILDDARARMRKPRPNTLQDSTSRTLSSRCDNAFSVAGSTEWAVSLLAQLSDEQATAIALRVLADMPAKEVAAVMDISPGSVRVHTHRGLAKLRELLESHHDPGADATKYANLSKNIENVVTLSLFRSLTPDA